MGAFSGDCPSPSLEPPLPCLQSCLLHLLPSPRSPLSRGTTSLPSAIHPTVCTLIVASLRKCSPFTQCHHLALFGHRSLICFLANISIFFMYSFTVLFNKNEFLLATASLFQLNSAFRSQEEVENRVTCEINVARLSCQGHSQFCYPNPLYAGIHNKNPAQNPEVIPLEQR